MAGSLRDFVYVDNFGERWSIRADESNVEAINAAVDVADQTYPQYRIPQNLKIRQAVYSNAQGTRNLKIPVLTSERVSAIPGTTGGVPAAITDPLDDQNNNAIVLVFNYFIPETLKDRPKVFDTGLNDGDETEA